MKHLQYFENHEQYKSFLQNGGFDNSPFVAFCDEEDENHFMEESSVLTFVAEQDNSTIGMKGISDTHMGSYSCQINVNDTQWETYTVNYYGSGKTFQEQYFYSGRTITLQSGDYIRFIGNRNTSYDDKGGKIVSPSYFYFVMEGKIAAYGDVTSLKNGVGGDDIFSCGHLFENCTALTHAPNLPSTQFFDGGNYAKTYGYYCLFKGCTSLTSPPELKITNLMDYCFYGMFSGCTSLTAAPNLPYTSLSAYCYQNMFEGCISLSTAPSLPATNLTEGCYYSMFKDCTSLVASPTLAASSAVLFCYYQMFYRCSNLNLVRAYFTNQPTTCVTNWLVGVASKGKFYKNRYASWSNNNPNNIIPSGWTVYNV